MAAAVQVIQSPEAAEKLLKPERLRILQLLGDPNSASGVARLLAMPRQTVNYHLRELEKEGFIEFVEQRPNRNCLERFLRARARSFVISPAVLGALGIDAVSTRDRFSVAYLIAAAARVIREIAVLRGRADEAKKTLATLTVETEIQFASAQARKQFSDEVVQSIASLALKYHDEKAPAGRRFRFLLAGYPVLKDAETGDRQSVTVE